MGSTELRAAAQQALEALEGGADSWQLVGPAIDALRAALAEPEGGGNLPPPLPGDFDHAIGADRFKVVRGAFWWHVLIGDSPTEHGKFLSRAGAEKMAADLLREFRNGAFVQHKAALAEQRLTDMEQEMERSIESLKAALAEPVQPVAWQERQAKRMRDGIVTEWTDWYPCQYRTADKARAEVCDQIPYEWRPLFTAPPQRKPLTEEEIDSIWDSEKAFADIYAIARAVERAHGIGSQQ